MTPTDTNKLPAEVLERMARLLDPIGWRVLDSYLAEMLRKYKGERIGYDAEQFKDKSSMDLAQAAYDASPGPGLEAENARLRAEHLKTCREAEEYFSLRARGLLNLTDDEVRRLGFLEREILGDARTAIARAKGE